MSEFTEMIREAAKEVVAELIREGWRPASPWLKRIPAAERANLKPRGMDQMVRDGSFPAPVRPTHKVQRWHVDVIDAWLRASAFKPEHAMPDPDADAGDES